MPPCRAAARRAGDGCVADATSRQRDLGSGAAGACARGGSERVGERELGRAARAVVAGGLERGRRASGSTSPPVSSAASRPAAIAVRSSGEAGTSVASAGVEPAQLAVGAEAAQRRVEVLEERAALAAVASSSTSSRTVGAHAVEGVSVMRTGWSAAAGAGRAGAGAGAPARGPGAGADGRALRRRSGGLRAAGAGRSGGAPRRGGARRSGSRSRARIRTLRGAAWRPRPQRLARPDRRIGAGAHLEREQRGDREEQPERARDHRQRPGLADRLPAAASSAEAARWGVRSVIVAATPRPRPRPESSLRRGGRGVVVAAVVAGVVVAAVMAGVVRDAAAARVVAGVVVAAAVAAGVVGVVDRRAATRDGVLAAARAAGVAPALARPGWSWRTTWIVRRIVLVCTSAVGVATGWAAAAGAAARTAGRSPRRRRHRAPRGRRRRRRAGCAGSCLTPSAPAAQAPAGAGKALAKPRPPRGSESEHRRGARQIDSTPGRLNHRRRRRGPGRARDRCCRRRRRPRHRRRSAPPLDRRWRSRRGVRVGRGVAVRVGSACPRRRRRRRGGRREPAPGRQRLRREPDALPATASSPRSSARPRGRGRRRRDRDREVAAPAGHAARP